MEWLTDAVAGPMVPWTTLAARLAASLVFGLAVAGVYLVSQRRPAGERESLATTIVLMTVLVAMTTLVIGDSVPRAFGLVGALSIVRFRTVVEDTRDTAFVIFAVVIGMAIGAGYYAIALMGGPLVAAAAIGLGLVTQNHSAFAASRELQIRLTAGCEPGPALESVLHRHLARFRLETAATARQGAALDLHYRVVLRDSAAAGLSLLKELQQTDGVQNVELRSKD
ncbi:MAG: DUF4956 domain-containing protein [Pirellulaceae bacterium]|nr:DUF4956 domain-containing protein [Pirellulaceae bacterium]